MDQFLSDVDIVKESSPGLCGMSHSLGLFALSWLDSGCRFWTEIPQKLCGLRWVPYQGVCDDGSPSIGEVGFDHLVKV